MNLQHLSIVGIGANSVVFTTFTWFGSTGADILSRAAFPRFMTELIQFVAILFASNFKFQEWVIIHFLFIFQSVMWLIKPNLRLEFCVFRLCYIISCSKLIIRYRCEINDNFLINIIMYINDRNTFIKWYRDNVK